MNKLMLLRRKNDDSLLNAPTCYMLDNYKECKEYKSIKSIVKLGRVKPLCNYAVGVIQNEDLVGVKLSFHQGGQDVIKMLLADALLKWLDDVTGSPFVIGDKPLIAKLKKESKNHALIVDRCVSNIEEVVNGNRTYKYLEGLELINELEGDKLQSPVNLLGGLLQYHYKYRGYELIMTLEEFENFKETERDSYQYFTKEIMYIGDDNMTFTDTHPLLGELFENNGIVTENDKYNIERLNADDFVIVFKVLTTHIEGSNLHQLLAKIYEMYKEDIGHDDIWRIQRTVENMMYSTVLESSNYIKDNIYKLGGIKL